MAEAEHGWRPLEAIGTNAEAVMTAREQGLKAKAGFIGIEILHDLRT